MKTARPTILQCSRAGMLLSMLLLSSCATRPSSSVVGPALPPEVTMNKDAGRGNQLIVLIRVEGGGELPFMVDTGGYITLLDKSLEPRLGECLGACTLSNFGATYDANFHAAPQLYLGNTPLATGGFALTSAFLQKASTDAGRPVLGLLGMDCLRHYCVQLDFTAGKMRFLDPNSIRPERLGTAYPLTFSTEGQGETGWTRPYVHCPGLAGGEETDLLVDVGYSGDGGLDPELFRRALAEDRLRVEADADDAQEPNSARVSECDWNGASYTDVYVGKGENALGLRFLARHLVTFDFPHRMMYLKRTRSGPLFSRDLVAAAKAAEKSAYKTARKLMRNGQLPGWAKQDHGKFTMFHFHADPDTVTYDMRKRGDSATCHYQFSRASKDAPWTLQKAWRTDPDDRTIEQYPIP